MLLFLKYILLKIYLKKKCIGILLNFLLLYLYNYLLIGGRHFYEFIICLNAVYVFQYILYILFSLFNHFQLLLININIRRVWIYSLQYQISSLFIYYILYYLCYNIFRTILFSS